LQNKKTLHSDAKRDSKKFLDLWRDANPGIAEDEDAKEKVAGVRNN
jgi:hypothetical protein